MVMIHSLGVDTPDIRPLARRDRVVGPRRGASGEKQNIEFLIKAALARVLLIPACLMKSPHTSASGRVNWTRRSGGCRLTWRPTPLYVTSVERRWFASSRSGVRFPIAPPLAPPYNCRSGIQSKVSRDPVECFFLGAPPGPGALKSRAAVHSGRARSSVSCSPRTAKCSLAFTNHSAMWSSSAICAVVHPR